MPVVSVWRATWQLWLVTVLAAATWCREATLTSRDQAARAAWPQASCRTRSAVVTAPSHNTATDSVPPGTRRGGREFTGIAYNSSRPAGDAGFWRCAVWIEESRAHSDWQAALSLRRAWPVPGPLAGADSARSATCGAILRAITAISMRSARIAAGEVMTAAHSERCCRLPSALTARWVCSRSRPAVSQTDVAANRRPRSLAGGDAGLPLPCWGGSNRAALLSASCACEAARAHAASAVRVADGSMG